MTAHASHTVSLTVSSQDPDMFKMWTDADEAEMMANPQLMAVPKVIQMVK